MKSSNLQQSAPARLKLLYITDQQEYTDHGTIGPLFNGYLKEHMDVNIVYFTKYKHSFQAKGSDFVVPSQYKKDICSYLESKDVKLGAYDFIFVRNMTDILANVLKNRKQYGYKVGFRVSFPKTEEAYEALRSESSLNVLGRMGNAISRYNKKRLINQCDLFMPASYSMKDTFYGDCNVKTLALPAGLDPARITPHRESEGEERHFIYVGTLDSMRRFEEVLVAFTNVSSSSWHLNISTFNPEFARTVMGRYPSIADKVTIMSASNLNELMVQVDDCDVGIAMLPELAIYNTAVPAKIMDYYTCAIPALLTDNAKNRSLFSDEDALFCEFDTAAITAKLDEIIAMTQEEIAKMGTAGQQKLLAHERNSELMAEELHEVLAAL